MGRMFARVQIPSLAKQPVWLQMVNSISTDSRVHKTFGDTFLLLFSVKYEEKQIAYSLLIQLGEGNPYKIEVGGSSPSQATKYSDVPQRLQGSVHTRVFIGSNPIIATKEYSTIFLNKYLLYYFYIIGFYIFVPLYKTKIPFFFRAVELG